MYSSEKIKGAIGEMFGCRSLFEHVICYQQNIELLKEWTFVVFSEKEGAELPIALHTNFDNDFAVTNLGCANRYYSVDQQICEEMLETGQTDYNIESCVELDTQAVSYLKNIFGEDNQTPDFDKIVDFVRYLQQPEVNYSCLPYLIENASKKNVIDKIECYRNIKSYMLFKYFDYSKSIAEGKCVYSISEDEIQLETDGLFNSMLSESFSRNFGNYFELQKSIYCLLSKAICIEFMSPKRSAKNKLLELLDFVNEKLGYVAERELEVCYHYFEHDERVNKFFKKVQKNSKNLSGVINGMAWDLVHVRLIERELLLTLSTGAKYGIYFLLTFDKGLKEIMQINPVEQIAFCDGVLVPKLKNSWIDSITGAQEKIKENERKRYMVFETRDIDVLEKEVEDEMWCCLRA